MWRKLINFPTRVTYNSIIPQYNSAWEHKGVKMHSLNHKKGMRLSVVIVNLNNYKCTCTYYI